ncbi:hypothetical protein B0J11DRAFT_525837 [Dendryphion nanum]|uniref:Uncharacterized protein n=1 Tax=Dendryphion nanum TaxID=256645 RepID=A0A9P9DZV5_9PLEO|nr:hypothetical protein B0J11DRAFT_525837 [Dendryphion nanum]
MLERASTCLDTGGRRLFRNHKRCLRSRRMLHSTFWYHGATVLNLPSWWPTSPIIDRTGGDTEGVAEASPHGMASTSQPGLLLDFLYPVKTMAMIQRIAKYRFDLGELQRKRHLGRNSTRQFSTTQWRATPEEPTRLDKDTVKIDLQLKMEIKQRLVGSTAVDALQDLLASEERDKFELAWRLYRAVQQDHHTPELDVNLLIYFGSPSTRVEAMRVLQVFDALAPWDRMDSSYRAAISAHLFLDQIDQAVKLHDGLNQYHSKADVGTGLILGRTVGANNWEQSLHVFQTFLQNTQKDHLDYIGLFVRNADSEGKATIETLWGEVSHLPYVRGNLESFLLYLRENEGLLSNKDDREGVCMFLEGLAREAMEQVLRADPPNEDTIWDFFLTFFQNITRSGLRTTSLYEYAIRRCIDMPRYQKYTNQRKPWLQLYEWFRNSTWMLPTSTTKPKIKVFPSRKLLRQLMYHVGRHQSSETSRERVSVETLVADSHHFYPSDTFPLSTLKFLIHFYAKRGEADRVHEIFNEIQKKFRDNIDLHILSTLPYVYARRVDIRSAEEQFKRINTEFGFTPNTPCWNALLLAYVRADNLDGSLACFNRILQAGATPTLYTITPLLDLCAERGDVEAFETIFSKAEQLKIDVRTSVWARAGYVQACLLSNDPQGAESIAQTMFRNNQSGTLPGDLTHVWNLLVNYYALKGDIFNTRRLYQQMQQNKIPLDSWTYGSLVRALVEVRQTNAGYKIIRVTMPENNVRVHAFHYALVMTGFLREKQYPEAMRAYQRMCARNVSQTHASRMTSLRVMGIEELRMLEKEKPDQPKERLIEVERTLREILLEDFEAGVARSEPRLERSIDSREYQLPAGYFGLLIMLYTARGAFDICKEMFEASKIAPASDQDFTAPIELLNAIMHAHNEAKEYDEVAKCFELARTQADSLVKTLQNAISSRPAPMEFDSLVDPTILEKFQESKIAPNRRHILANSTRIYIRSLIRRNEERPLQEAQRTIRSLLINGYVIDNLTWNEMIQSLAQHARVMDAFSACEMYLMPNFPGWRYDSPSYIRKNIRGHPWMEVRHTDVNRLVIMPRYKTLVALAAAFTQIKRDEANGMGYNPDMGGWTREALEKLAPNTVRAIETMPRIGDILQQQYLGVDP